MAAVNTGKMKLANQILANNAFLSDSGIVERLRTALMKLSKTDLADLSFVIGCKESVEQKTWQSGKSAIFGDNGRWHPPVSAHPATCPGCTANESKWGQPLTTRSAEDELVRTTCFHCGEPAMPATHGFDPRCERHADV